VKYLVIALMFFCLRSVAASLEGELTPLVNTSVSLEEGALFEGVLRVWPVSSEWENANLLKLEKKKLGENFHIVKVISSELSAHNQEVAELKAVIAVIKAVKPKEKIFVEIQKQRVPLEIRRITTIATAPPAQDFSFVEQPEYESANREELLLYVGGASSSVIVIIALVFLLYSVRKKKAALSFQKQLRQRIETAQTREAIEALARDLSEIEIYIQVKNKDVFLSKLNAIQFKKNWTESETQNIIETKQKLLHD